MNRLATDTEERIRQSRAARAPDLGERRLKYLLSASPAVLYTARAAGDYGATWVSDNVTAQLGYRAQQFTADPGFWLSHVHPEDAPRVLAGLRELFDKGRLAHEYRFRHAGGGWRWMRDELNLERDARGTPREIVGYWIDITRRKEAELALRRTHDELEARVAARTAELKEGNRIVQLVARGAPLDEALRHLVRHVESRLDKGWCSILLLDEGGRHLRLGAAEHLPAAYNRAIDGIEIGPAVGSCGTAAFTGKAVIVTDIASDPLWADFRALALSHGLRACWSVPVLGIGRKVMATLAMYYREPRAPRREEIKAVRAAANIAGLALDLSRLKRQLNERETELERFGRLTLVEGMAASIAHELNQPLAAVLYTLSGAIEYGRRRRLRKRTLMALLQAASTQAGRAAAILWRVREFTQRHAPKRGRCAVAAIVREALVLCAPEIHRHRAVVRLNPGPAKLAANCDRLEIAQVLVNLLHNAVQAMARTPRDSRRIRLSVRRAGAAQVEIAVTDTGSGIGGRDSASLFEPFRSTREEGRTGLGLAICRHIVEAHGGRIWLEPGKRGGTVARFTLRIK